MFVLIMFLLLLLLIIIVFSFPRFSPIPYFPTNKKDLPLIIKALHLENEQTVFDLGAGDGTVIFVAAKEAWKKKLNTRFVAVEINPVLILIMQVKRLFSPNTKNIKIVWSDLFKLNLKSFTFHVSRLPRAQSRGSTFYLYVSPWFLKRIISYIKKQALHFRLISYMYPVKSLQNKQRIISGRNKIFIYNL